MGERVNGLWVGERKHRKKQKDIKKNKVAQEGMRDRQKRLRRESQEKAKCINVF